MGLSLQNLNCVTTQFLKYVDGEVNLDDLVETLQTNHSVEKETSGNKNTWS